MRMSCNGCRVLRKGCNESCSIRPCLQWIKSPEAQANATVFLAKFYGRAGLLNLINSGPDHLRPAIFKSLLYEACGRIVNPIYGSVGLLWSGSWPMVQAAVDAVMKGAPIASIPSETAAAGPVPHQSYDIRHISKVGPDAELHKVSKITRTRFKRTAKSNKTVSPPLAETSHEHSDHTSELAPAEPRCSGAPRESSVDTHEAASHVSQGEQSPVEECGDMTLDLTLGLGFEPVKKEAPCAASKPSTQHSLMGAESTGACSFSLALQLSA